MNSMQHSVNVQRITVTLNPRTALKQKLQAESSITIHPQPVTSLLYQLHFIGYMVQTRDTIKYVGEILSKYL